MQAGQVHPTTPSPALVTIVLTTCDRPAELTRAVASVLAQDDPRWSLLVVDDGTANQTTQISDDPRIKRLRTTGRIGAAAARNLGLERVSTTWAAILDDDDEIEPGWAAHFNAHFAERSAPAFTLSDWRIFDYDEAGAVIHERRRTYDLTPEPSPQNVQQALRAGACGLAVNREAIMRAGLFDPQYRLTEDTEWLLRLIEADCQILYAAGPGFVIHNRPSADRLSSDARLGERIEECRALKARYGDLGGRFPALGPMFDGLIGNYEARRAV